MTIPKEVAFRLERGHLPVAAEIPLLVVGALAVMAGAPSLLYALGGPFEAELELRGEEGIYVKKLFAWGRRRTFPVRSLTAESGYLYAQTPDGSSFRLFDTVPLRCHLYIEQFVKAATDSLRTICQVRD